MRSRKLRILQCWNEVTPEGRIVQKWEDLKKPKEISGADIDVAKRQAKKMLKGMGYDVRSISFCSDGSMQAMVWRDGKPQTQKKAGMVWKRPASSDPKNENRPKKKAAKKSATKKRAKKTKA